MSFKSYQEHTKIGVFLLKSSIPKESRRVLYIWQWNPGRIILVLQGLSL